jgi:hypothetical protein
MRHLTMLALGLTLVSAVPAARAATPGRTCRSACAPRIAEQCGAATGRALKRCRRPLIRACKAATPDVACATKEDLTSALGDKQVTPAADSTLRLCQDGSFFIADNAPVGDTSRTGTWDVEIVSGSLVIALAPEVGQPEQFTAAPDGAGGFVIGGTQTDAQDATEACNPPPPPVGVVDPEPTLDPRDPERVLAVARALTDRLITRNSSAANGIPEQENFELCSGGGVNVDTIAATFVPGHDSGTWDLDEAGTHLLLTLRQGLLPSSFQVSVTDDGRVLLDGEQVEVRDGRGICADVDLETRFTALLPGTAYTFRSGSGSTLQLVATVAFCDATHFSRRVNFGATSGGTWAVTATNGVATLHFTDTATGLTADQTLTQADDGSVLIDGVAPSTSPTPVLRAQCS